MTMDDGRLRQALLLSVGLCKWITGKRTVKGWSENQLSIILSKKRERQPKRLALAFAFLSVYSRIYTVQLRLPKLMHC